MRDRALKWSLWLLGFFLAIGPLLVALGTHNWDIKAAVLPSEAEMAEVQNTITGIYGGGLENTLSQVQGTINGIFGGGFSENMFSPGLPTLGGNTIRIPIQFTSPFNIPIKIKSLSGSVSDLGVEIAQVQMEEDEVEVPAGGTVNFTLVGTYTGGVPTNPQFSMTNIAFEFYDIPIQFTSPFNIPIKIKDFSASISDTGVEIAQIQMEEAEVEIPAMGTANFTLAGTYTGAIPTNPQLSSANVTFEFYGVSIQLHIAAGGGGP